MFPILTTTHFTLRQIVESDQPKIYEGLSHPEVIKYYGVSYNSVEQTRIQMDWYAKLIEEQTGIWWAICYHRHPSVLIGACGFNYWKREHKKTELGYWLLPGHWKKNIMRECIPEIIHYAFTVMDIHRIEAVVETENTNSMRLLKKLNFVYEGVLRESEIKNDKWVSMAYYALLNSE